MRLFDVYVNKKNKKDIIQIDSFATHISDSSSDIVVYRNIEKHNEYEIGSCPSCNGYGSSEEIEKEYKLLVSTNDLSKYDSWNDIFELANKK